ncbi:hypothetical protein [Herbiconiux sp. YIM B11900]|uniref:hypothetical protein n=1 Tax=Herbiconiux sp. YIM B11900 TaxID=3404131 RepID=UPI003F82CF93
MRTPSPLPSAVRDAPFSVAQGEEAGLSRKRMLAADLRMPFRGTRIARDAQCDLSTLCLAYALVMPPEQCFSHATAAAIWGIPLPREIELDERVHVSTLDGGCRPRMRGVVGHELTSEHARVVVRHGLAVTDPVTTWLQLAGTLGPRWMVAAGDHLVLDPIVADPEDPRPYVDLEELRMRVLAFSGRNCLRAREAVVRVRRAVESPRETFLRLELVDSGLPEPETNARIYDRSGSQIAIGDLVYREQRVVVEYDGEQHRTDSKQYRRDIRRHDDLLAEHWTHIRLGKHSPPAEAVARTRAALHAASLRTPDLAHPSLSPVMRAP